MEKITVNTVPEEIEILRPYAPYLLWQPALEGERRYPSLAEWAKACPAWPTESMILGLERLTALMEKQKVLYDVYAPEEIAEDPTLADVKFWYMPASEQPSEKPFVLCFPGGGYSSVCTLAEGFTTAARMNDLGYNVFVLNYRVALPDLMPKPIDDIAALLRRIFGNMEEFGLTNREYAMTGFSAGANLICNWGLDHLGYKKYGLPAPKAMFPVYPVTAWDADPKQEDTEFLVTTFGSKLSEETLREYHVVNNASADYPPCYLVHARDDSLVPYQNSTLLKDKLESLGVPVRLELAEFGDHGFADGRNSGAEGWPVRALHFMENLG